MKLLKKAGSTSEIWQIFVADSSSTTGAGLTGLTNASSGLVAYYHRDTDTTATAISLVSMTVGTFTSSGFKEIDATNMPGFYQFCPPNAALASGAKSCAFHLKGATNMAPLPLEVQLVACDPDDAVRLGLTALPNAAAEAAGGLYTRGTGAGQINQANNGQIDANAARTGGTTNTGRDIGASVLLSSGTGTGQLDFTSGVVKANATQLLGTAWLTPAVAGTPDVNAKQLGGVVPGSATIGTVTTTTTATNLTTNNDKSGYALSSAGVQAIWDALTSALTTAGSVGKRIVDYLGGGSKVAATVATGDGADAATAIARLTATRAGYLDNLSAGAVATASALATVQSDTDDIQTRLPAALVGGRMDSSVGAMAANVVTAAAVADGAIDAAAFAADTGLVPARTGTAQGGNSNAITLDAGASAVSNFYVGATVYTTGGTGAGQWRAIISYNGSTKSAGVYPSWATAPNGTTTFAVVGKAAATLTSDEEAAISTTIWEDVIANHSGSLGSTAEALAAAQTNSAVALARLGAFAGSGLNTVLGAFKALLSKTAGTPSDVGGTFDPATDSTEAIRDRGDAAWTTATGFSTLDAAGVRTAVGLATANLDAQLAALPQGGNYTAARAAKLDNLDRAISAVLTTAMAESYNADGVAPTAAQALFVVMQRLVDFSISGTSISVKKIDGTTQAFVLTLDSATAPTSSARSS